MISIIIPVYRSEKTLERCIKSLLNQTYQNIELLIIVDSPPDASGILADRLAGSDKRIRVIHQDNKGVSFARNTGIREAKGEYIQFVDSDDYVEETLCEKLLAALEKTKADLALCGFHHLYFGRDVIKVPAGREEILTKEDEKDFFLLYGTQFLNMPWNKLYKRELIQKLFRENMDLGEDLLFNLDYIRQTEKITVVFEPLCYYIQDGRGTTLSTKRRANRMENAILLYEEIKSFAKDMYGSSDTGRIAESRILAEFMDEMEGLAFAEEMNFGEKRKIIQNYYQGYEQIDREEKIPLPLLDYRILYFCFKRKWFRIQLILIELRGILARMFRKAG